MYKSQSVSLTRSVVRIKAKNTDFDAYAKRLDALSFSCNGHLCFLLLGNFRRESFFFVKPRKDSVVGETRLVQVKRLFCFRQRMLLLVEVFRRF